MEKKSIQPAIIVAAAAFLLYILNIHAITFWSFLTLAGIAVILFCLIKNRRDVVLAAGFALMALPAIYYFFAGFGSGAYKVGYWRKDDAFNLFCMLPSLFRTVGLTGAAVICFAERTQYLPQLKTKMKRFWFAPAVGIAAAPVLSFVVRLAIHLLSGGYWYGGMYSLPGFFFTFVLAAAYLISMAWTVSDDGTVDFGILSQNKGPISKEKMYCGIGKFIALTLLTCGIWLCIWVYRMTRYTNEVTGLLPGEEDRNPTTELLLWLFLPFYGVYWIYKTAQRVDAMTKSKLPESRSMTVLCLALAVVAPIVSLILLQDKINVLLRIKDNLFV